MSKISHIKCDEILNSRGEWTIDTHIFLENGVEASQSIPSGASKGENEVLYITPEKAVGVIEGTLSKALKGQDVYQQEDIDSLMRELDGTDNLSKLGGNSILSVSLAAAKASAKDSGIEVYEYLHTLYSGRTFSPKAPVKFPTPLFNVVNGGKHAQSGLSVQEFMLIPAVNSDFKKAMAIGVTSYHLIREALVAVGFSTGVGDEGGFAPKGFTTKKVFDFIEKAISPKYKIGKDVFFGMDVAAGSFFSDGKYTLPEEKLVLDGDGLLEYYSELLLSKPFIYLEDPFYEQAFDSWQKLMKLKGSNLMVVADDLVVTNAKYLQLTIENKYANSVIIKPNQVGTLTDTFRFAHMAQAAGFNLIVSHRSGDNADDTFIADLAVAIEADFIKAGAPVRGERVAKYNRLLEIRGLLNG